MIPEKKEIEMVELEGLNCTEQHTSICAMARERPLDTEQALVADGSRLHFRALRGNAREAA